MNHYTEPTCEPTPISLAASDADFLLAAAERFDALDRLAAARLRRMAALHQNLEVPTLADAVLEVERAYWMNAFPQRHGDPDGVVLPRCTPLRVILDAVTAMLPEAQRPQVAFGKVLRAAPPPSEAPRGTTEEV